MKFNSYKITVIYGYSNDRNNLYECFHLLMNRKDFATYAELCFEKFGDRVKHWITFNEPHTFAMMGYDLGLEAPGRCSILLHQLCRHGNSSTEPYIVAHNVLNSHAIVVDIYRKKYKVIKV